MIKWIFRKLTKTYLVSYEPTPISVDAYDCSYYMNLETQFLGITIKRFTVVEQLYTNLHNISKRHEYWDRLIGEKVDVYSKPQPTTRWVF